jgi:hypothetical protein
MARWEKATWKPSLENEQKRKGLHGANRSGQGNDLKGSYRNNMEALVAF